MADIQYLTADITQAKERKKKKEETTG